MWSDSRWMRRDGGDLVCRVRFAGVIREDRQLKVIAVLSCCCYAMRQIPTRYSMLHSILDDASAIRCFG